MEPVVVALPIVIGLVALYFGLRGHLSERATGRSRARLQTFRKTRTRLKAAYSTLVEERLVQHNASRIGELRLLGRPSWIFDEPMPLDAIEIRLAAVRSPEEYLPMVEQTRFLWPRAQDGTDLLSYSEAIREYDKPLLWSEGTDTYRLVDVRREGARLALSYELGKYHDATDTQEAFAYVLAAGLEKKLRTVPDPLDLRQRCASTAICTLTLVDGAEPHFVFHHRSDANVLQAIGQFHVVPAGEFEPAIVDPDPLADFDLWQNIKREFAEEFLGLPDGLAIPLNDRPPEDHPALVALEERLHSGDLTLWTYGIGMIPVSFKPELLTVAVVKEPSLEGLFPRIDSDHEGKKKYRPFTEENVRALLEDPRLNPVAHAILTFAWRDRERLLTHADVR